MNPDAGVMTTAAADALNELGFTELESLAYCFLLGESPATGYRVSHGIGKPTANTYKALSALARAGAVVSDDGDSQLFRAVPPEELLAQLEQRFRENRSRAADRLSAIRRDSADDRVYQLRSVDQVLERARAMLKRARKIVLLDAFPEAYRVLEADIAAVAKRGRQVALKAYSPVETRGVNVVLAADAPKLRALWPGEQLNIVVDAREHLLSLLSRDLATVHQAVWSNSTFLSCMQHNNLASEIALGVATSEGNQVQRGARFHRSIALTSSGAPGLEDLLRRFGTPESRPKGGVQR